MVPPNSGGGGGAVLPAHCPFLLFGFHLAFLNTLTWPLIGTAHFTTTHLSSFQSQTFTRKRRIVSIPLATIPFQTQDLQQEPSTHTATGDSFGLSASRIKGLSRAPAPPNGEQQPDDGNYFWPRRPTYLGPTMVGFDGVRDTYTS